MTAVPHLRLAEDSRPSARLTGDHWWGADHRRHTSDSPRHCANCGSPIDDESGMVVEYWESDRRIYHVWCSACGWAGDVVTIDRLIGHEPDH